MPIGQRERATVGRCLSCGFFRRERESEYIGLGWADFRISSGAQVLSQVTWPWAIGVDILAWNVRANSRGVREVGFIVHQEGELSSFHPGPQNRVETALKKP